MVKRDVIRSRALELLREYGAGVASREVIVTVLMNEFGISDQSAIQYRASQCKELSSRRMYKLKGKGK